MATRSPPRSGGSETGPETIGRPVDRPVHDGLGQRMLGPLASFPYDVMAKNGWPASSSEPPSHGRWSSSPRCWRTNPPATRTKGGCAESFGCCAWLPARGTCCLIATHNIEIRPGDVRGRAAVRRMNGGGQAAPCPGHVVEEGSLVKTWAMRGTLHLFSADEFPLYAVAMQSRDHWRKPYWLKAFGVSLGEMEAIIKGIHDVLDDGRHLTREQLSAEAAAAAGALAFGPNVGRNVSFVRPDRWLAKWRDVDPVEAIPGGAAKVRPHARPHQTRGLRPLVGACCRSDPHHHLGGERPGIVCPRATRSGSPARRAISASRAGHAACSRPWRSGRRSPTYRDRGSIAGRRRKREGRPPGHLPDARADVRSRRLVPAPGVQGVVHRRLQLDLLVVLGAEQQSEAVGDRRQATPLGRRVVLGDVGGVHDLGQPDKCRI